MQQTVIRATQRIEVDVLDVVTSEDLDVLERLNRAAQSADEALRALVESDHVIDVEYMQQFGRAQEAAEASRTAALSRWRELFD